VGRIELCGVPIAEAIALVVDLLLGMRVSKGSKETENSKSGLLRKSGVHMWSHVSIIKLLRYVARNLQIVYGLHNKLYAS
jgi:hypothetical protein